MKAYFLLRLSDSIAVCTHELDDTGFDLTPRTRDRSLVSSCRS